MTEVSVGFIKLQFTLFVLKLIYSQCKRFAVFLWYPSAQE